MTWHLPHPLARPAEGAHRRRVPPDLRGALRRVRPGHGAVRHRRGRGAPDRRARAGPAPGRGRRDPADAPDPRQRGRALRRGGRPPARSRLHGGQLEPRLPLPPGFEEAPRGRPAPVPGGRGRVPGPDRARRCRCALSIKMRLGRTTPDEIFKLLPVLDRYPLSQIVIHPRTARQMYGGRPDLDDLRKLSRAQPPPHRLQRGHRTCGRGSRSCRRDFPRSTSG